jgi:hypothetical protein
VVCKYGIVSGQTCGKITRLNDTHPDYPFGAQTYIRVTCNPGTINCALGGDSGAPVYRRFIAGTFRLGIAYGVLSGGAQPLNFLTYMPINYISALGVTVLERP